jgi:hypothetical protein
MYTVIDKYEFCFCHYTVNCRKQKETQWIMSEEQLNDNSVVVQGLDPGHIYEFRVVAVDGRFETPSAVQDIHTYAHLPSASDRGSSINSSSGWFIGTAR